MYNINLQMKLLWKTVNNPDKLWVDLVSKKYLRGSPLFEYVSSSNFHGNGNN